MADTKVDVKHVVQSEPEEGDDSGGSEDNNIDDGGDADDHKRIASINVPIIPTATASAVTITSAGAIIPQPTYSQSAANAAAASIADLLAGTSREHIFEHQ